MQRYVAWWKTDEIAEEREVFRCERHSCSYSVTVRRFPEPRTESWVMMDYDEKDEQQSSDSLEQSSLHSSELESWVHFS